MKKILIFGLIALLIATTVTAKVETVEDLEAKRDKINTRIEKLKLRISRLEVLLAKLNSNLEKKELKILSYEQKIQDLNTCEVSYEDIEMQGNGNISLRGDYFGDCGREYIIEATTSARKVTETRTQVGKIRFSDNGGNTWSDEVFCAGSVDLSNGLRIYCNGGSKIQEGDLWTFTIG